MHAINNQVPRLALGQWIVHTDAAIDFVSKRQNYGVVARDAGDNLKAVFIAPFTCVIPSKSVTKEVERLCRGFLWGTKDERLKIHMTSWEKVCLPKAYGGLGFKEGTKWNYAMLSKLELVLEEALQAAAYFPKGGHNEGRFVLWQIVNSPLLTRDNLRKFHVEIVTWSCPVCGDHLKTHDHLFFTCSLSQRVLSRIFVWLGYTA
uniref:Reverse transcriptase zinc-binding domain-containing protein n=1 Tax=Cannabis sativa TaxID=3483 RepID=A0A803QBI6_CANSA